MKKASYEVKIVSYGVYSGWDSLSKELPKIVKFSDTIPARLDIEFGMIVNIKKAKGKSIQWYIDHPNISDKEGRPMARFEGQTRIKSADWKFFLGDTFWEPLEDKLGDWHLSIEMDGKVLAQKTFHVVVDDWSILPMAY